MSASRDWDCMEAEISALLPGVAPKSARSQLLAKLDEYATAAVREARALGPIGPSGDECTRALEWLLRPLFICGHQRSGTTLLQSLLDGHPQLLVLPSEGTYFTSFAYAARAAPSDAALDAFAAEWVRRFVDPNFAPHFRLGRSRSERKPAVDFVRALLGWHEGLRSRVPQTFAALLALVAAYRATTAPSLAPLLWVEKTPQNERYVNRFAPLRHARFIQLVRDPRTTFASIEEVYRSNGLADFDGAQQARAIGRSLRLASLNQVRLADRYLVVRYEELAEQTQQEVERVRQFLGIAADPALSLPTASGTAVRANSAFARPEVGVIEPPRRLHSSQDENAVLLGAYAGREARPFGYSIPAPGQIAEAALRARELPRQALQAGSAALRAVTRALQPRHGDRSR